MQRHRAVSNCYWLLATGCWLLATGYWLLATGYWLLTRLESAPRPNAQQRLQCQNGAFPRQTRLPRTRGCRRAHGHHGRGRAARGPGGSDAAAGPASPASDSAGPSRRPATTRAATARVPCGREACPGRCDGHRKRRPPRRRPHASRFRGGRRRRTAESRATAVCPARRPAPGRRRDVARDPISGSGRGRSRPRRRARVRDLLRRLPRRQGTADHDPDAPGPHALHQPPVALGPGRDHGPSHDAERPALHALEVGAAGGREQVRGPPGRDLSGQERDGRGPADAGRHPPRPGAGHLLGAGRADDEARRHARRPQVHHLREPGASDLPRGARRQPPGRDAHHRRGGQPRQRGHLPVRSHRSVDGNARGRSGHALPARRRDRRPGHHQHQQLRRGPGADLRGQHRVLRPRLHADADRGRREVPQDHREGEAIGHARARQAGIFRAQFEGARGGGRSLGEDTRAPCGRRARHAGAAAAGKAARRRVGGDGEGRGRTDEGRGGVGPRRVRHVRPARPASRSRSRRRRR